MEVNRCVSAAEPEGLGNPGWPRRNVPKLCQPVPPKDSFKAMQLRQLRLQTTQKKLIVNRILKTFLAVLVVGGFFAASPVFAAFLTISNASFEYPVQTASPYYSIGIPGWVSVGNGSAGVQLQSQFASTFGTVPDGQQFGYLNISSTDIEMISQALTDTLQPSTKYTLTLDVGGRNDGLSPGTSYTVSLYAGASLLGTVTPITPPSGSWTPISLVYNSPSVVSPNNPLDIQISLPIEGSAGFVQLDFDNVTLDASPVPEPAIWQIALVLLLTPLVLRGGRLLLTRS